jgi:hypothetical protein
METIRTTIFLKSAVGPKPYKTCYFSEKEYQRLMKDYEEHQKTGEPREGAYVEAISDGGEHSVILEFEAIAHIKISTESKR